ncbi:VWA domain-containing protein [Cryomorphaceae bacterium 1068]|nr:VWA domain-containing protein [Cryomorphaceae bacterium 1068]
MNRSQQIGLVFAVLSTIGAGALWFYFRGEYTYAFPIVFWLLLIIPVLGFYHVFSLPGKSPKVTLSSLSQFPTDGAFTNELLIHTPLLLRSLGLAMVIIALARPQSSLSWQNTSTEGIDIVVAMDISASMLAQDFKPNRLESSKQVAIDFIEARPNDRMGLVVYEGESFTQSPLTTDHRVLVNLFKDIKTGMVQGGTAIGMGLATAVNRLRDSDAKSKVIILLTDGDNNAGSIAPLTAAEIAKSFGIRVYTIGVGSEGRALSPVAVYPDGRYKYDYVEVKIDEPTLKEIAKMTDGAYFRATDEKALAKIYAQIDRLEKTKINVTEHSRKAEEYYFIALIGSLLLLSEFFFRKTILQMLP